MPPRGLDYLRSFTDYEQKLPHIPREAFALDRFERVLQDLGRPHLGRVAIHITGTKGKGAATTFADAILRAHGVRTFRFMSPHVVSFDERISIDGAPIGDAAFDALTDEARPAFAAAMERGEPPTFFEALAAIGFLGARAARVDVDVLEVGLGGRLDATNVCDPVAAAITCVDLDHQRLLGDTIDKIAYEKAGVVKARKPIYFGGDAGAGGHAVVAARARERAAPLRDVGSFFEVERRRIGRLRDGRLGATFDGRAGDLRLLDADAPGGGTHQPVNALIGLALARDAASALGKSIDAERARRAIAEARLPGRAEEAPGLPRLVADGAHTPRSVDALFELVRAGFPTAPVVLLCGVTEERDPAPLLTPVRRYATHACFGPLPSARTADPRRLADVWRSLGGIAESFPSIEEAEKAAGIRAGAEGVVVATGSFYLAGEILGRRRALAAR